MIIKVLNGNSIIKWKYNDKDKWKYAEISDLIKAIEESEVYMNGKDYDLYLEGYKQGKKDFERPKGEWKIGGRTTHYHYCSICGKDGDLQDNFCRNCGAKMTKSNSDSETNYYGVKTVLLSQPSDEVATFDREEQPTVYPSRIGYQNLYCTEAPEEKKPKRRKRE